MCLYRRGLPSLSKTLPTSPPKYTLLFCIKRHKQRILSPSSVLPLDTLSPHPPTILRQAPNTTLRFGYVLHVQVGPIAHDHRRIPHTMSLKRRNVPNRSNFGSFHEILGYITCQDMYRRKLWKEPKLLQT